MFCSLFHCVVEGRKLTSADMTLVASRLCFLLLLGGLQQRLHHLCVNLVTFGYSSALISPALRVKGADTCYKHYAITGFCVGAQLCSRLCGRLAPIGITLHRWCRPHQLGSPCCIFPTRAPATTLMRETWFDDEFFVLCCLVTLLGSEAIKASRTLVILILSKGLKPFPGHILWSVVALGASRLVCELRHWTRPCGYGQPDSRSARARRHRASIVRARSGVPF